MSLRPVNPSFRKSAPAPPDRRPKSDSRSGRATKTASAQRPAECSGQWPSFRENLLEVPFRLGTRFSPQPPQASELPRSARLRAAGQQTPQKKSAPKAKADHCEQEESSCEHPAERIRIAEVRQSNEVARRRFRQSGLNCPVDQSGV